MTVKEAVSVLKAANDIGISWSGNSIPFDKDDLLMMDAYGGYIVNQITAGEKGYYEIDIAMRPIKAGCA